MHDASKGFILTRHLAASPERVFRAWLDPREIAAWWHPQDATTPADSVEVDARVGGRYRYAMVNREDGTTVVSGGVYREITPPTRLVFTWGEPDADPTETPIVTVSLAPEGDGTLLTLELRGVEGEPGDGYFYDGWASVLDSLEAHLGGEAGREGRS